jgi:hypothetical protein
MYMERRDGLCATFFVWLVADLVQGVLLGWVPPFDSGSPLDTLWHLPALLMLLAVVSRSWPTIDRDAEEYVEIRDERMDSLMPERTSLVAYVVALPAIHFASSVAGIQDDAILIHREKLLLIASGVITALREAEVGLARGKTVRMVIRELGISEQTYYRWRKEFGG